MKRGTPAHPKTLQLAAALNIPRYAAVGILESVWHFAAQYARRGDIGRHGDTAIAAGIGWSGDPNILVAALVSSGWVDRCDCHRLRVHDWPAHADQAVQKTREVTTDGFLECYAEEILPPPSKAPHRLLDQDRPGKIYFVQAGDDGPIKIGFSVNPWARIKSLQVASPVPFSFLGIIPGTLRDEEGWHQRFSEERIDGEWFARTKPLLEAISDAVASSSTTGLPIDDGYGTGGAKPAMAQAMAPAGGSGSGGGPGEPATHARRRRKAPKPGDDTPSAREGCADASEILGRRLEASPQMLGLFARLIREGRTREQWRAVLTAYRDRATSSAAFARDGTRERPGGPGLTWLLRPGEKGGFDTVLLQLQEGTGPPRAAPPRAPSSRAERIDAKVARDLEEARQEELRALSPGGEDR